MMFRVRWQKRGGHIHVRVFSATTSDQTFAKLGELTFDERDWEAFRKQLGAGWQFVNEDDDSYIETFVAVCPLCSIDDGLVQEWISKAREVARAKGYDPKTR